jgi:hypothetical protein
MLALANCKAALAGLSSSPVVSQARDLQQLIHLTKHNLIPSTTPAMSPTQPPEDTPPPRVQPQPAVPLPDLPSHVVHPPPPVLTVSSASNLQQCQAVARRTATRQRCLRDATLPFFYHQTHLPSAHNHVYNRPTDHPLRPHVHVAPRLCARAPPGFP